MARITEKYTRCWYCNGIEVEHQYDPAASDGGDKFRLNIPKDMDLYDMVALSMLLEQVRDSVGDKAWDRAVETLTKEG